MGSIRWPAIVGIVGSLALLAVGIATGQANWTVYATVLTLGGIGLVRLHRRVGLSPWTMWGLVVFGLGHVAGGMIPVGDDTLYGWWLVDGVLRYDNLQHAWGFGFVGRATWEALDHTEGRFTAVRRSTAFWVVVLGAGAFGALNEIVEYVLTLTLAQTNVGGYDNTSRDLIANAVGGLVAAMWTACGVSVPSD